jgi:hypothetical protein
LKRNTTGGVAERQPTIRSAKGPDLLIAAKLIQEIVGFLLFNCRMLYVDSLALKLVHRRSLKLKGFTPDRE